jgi:hypothetical protein
VRSPRPRFERRVTLCAVAGDELIHPRAGDVVAGRDFAGAMTLDDDSGDNETGK